MRPIYNKSLFQVAGFVWMLARLTTAGYKGSLWCQTQNSHPRLAGWLAFYGAMLHLLHHTIKAWSWFMLQSEEEREKASFAESDLYCSVEKRGVLDR